MKKLFKIALCFILSAVTIFGTASISFAQDTQGAQGTQTTQSAQDTQSAQSLKILFTHDMHSAILPFKTALAGETAEIAGYSRLKTAIDEERSENSLLLDAGDFSMGTFYNFIFEEHSPDLTLMGEMGFDATTLGNHEFDYGPSALASALLSAKNPPQLLVANLIYPEAKEAQELKSAVEQIGGKEYTIIEKNGIKVGLFGIIGEQAQSFTVTAAPVEFENSKEAAKRAVKALKEEGAQVIIALSHGGTNVDVDTSEDVALAKEVEGIDVIISGHTHTYLEKPIEVNNTKIVSAGFNAQALGVLEIEVGEKIKQTRYELIHTGSITPEDKEILKSANTFKDLVQKEHLDGMGRSYDGKLTTATFGLSNPYTNGYGNLNIADIITDGYLNEIKKSDSTATISAVNFGLIRETIYKGDVLESDAYNILSLGESPKDKSKGFPLVEFFVTGEELKKLCEVDVSISPMIVEAEFYFSGLRYTFNKSRLILNRVVDVEVLENGQWVSVDDKKLYGVICSIYIGQMAGLITDTTKGIISVQPRDKNGVPLTDLNVAILHDDEGRELKEWTSLSNYLSTFNGEIPQQYQSAKQTKTELYGTADYFKNTNTFAIVVYLIFFGICLLIAFIIYRVVRRIKRRRQNK